MVEDNRSDIAFAILQVAPALAGLVLVFLVFAVTRLIELRERDRPPQREVLAYRELTLLSATAIVLSLSATLASFGWLRDWWGEFEIVAGLFVASIVAVAVLTGEALRRAGLFG